MMTHREKATKDKHNSSQSTFLGHNPSAIQQQLDVFSNLFGDTASQKKTLTKKNSDENKKIGENG